MNYKEANEKLTGRCSESRKIENNTYLKRRGQDKIAILYHDTDVITFHANGQIDLNNGGYPTISTHSRMSGYLPDGYRVSGEPVETQRSNGGMSVLAKYHVKEDGSYQRITEQECTIDNTAVILPDGSIKGSDIVKYRAKRRVEKLEAARSA